MYRSNFKVSHSLTKISRELLREWENLKYFEGTIAKWLFKILVEISKLEDKLIKYSDIFDGIL
tara:strand:+ start:138 stop:326 length:189 start_codon:yes stop_codon:yes gene_type:complete